jgi:hypothetical protein
MAHSHPESLIAEFRAHLCRLHESRRDFAEAMAMTQKSIDESLALLVEMDAVMARR